jgi:hypothetical protein
MADQDYVDTLTGQLTTRRPDLLDLAEDELALLRGSMRKIAEFLHNPAIALDIRQNLARDLHLPEPTQ